MLKWNDTYATGNQGVDDQHKKLFEMVNNFEAAVRNKTAEASINETLQFLGSYVKTHFNFEEGCMDQAKCPAAADNKKAHAEFLGVYTQFANRFKTEGYSDALANELLKTAQGWLVKHICGIDIRLKHCAH